MASNHGKLLTTVNCLVLWHYKVPHAEVNDTENERGEKMERNGGGDRKGTANGNGNGQGTAKGEVDGSEEDNRERKRKSNR